MNEQKISKPLYHEIASSNYCPNSLHSLQMSVKELKENLLSAEEQIYQLNRCKAELSSELVNVKESNLKLLKEKGKCEKECQELREKLLVASNRNADLTEQLSEIAIENEKLSRMISMMAAGSDNPTFQNPHTYPWTQQRTNQLFQKNHSYTESCEEVTQKLLHQLKSEMKNMEDLGKKFALSESQTLKTKPYLDDRKRSLLSKEFLQSSDGSDSNDDDDVLKEIKSIKCNNSILKEKALSQHQEFQVVLLKLLSLAKREETRNYSNHKEISSKHIAGDKRYLPAQSNAEKFPETNLRAYFTYHLGSSAPPIPESPPEEERICPICQAVFPTSIPRVDFETHVVHHMDIENSSLLTPTHAELL